MRLVLAAFAAFAALLLFTGSAFAHAGESMAGASTDAVAGQAAPPEIPNPGPCTAAAAAAMPEGEGHDHQNIEQHRNLNCRFKQSAFLPLVEELKDRSDVVLGEMDVKADIAAVSVIYPEGGLLFFDVSDPAKPKFLSWYRDANCESVAVANNCGAFVDLSADAKTAIIGVQNLTLVPFPDPDMGGTPIAQPGVRVVDISDPRNPEPPAENFTYPVLSQGGVHTARTFPVADGPAKGEYVYAIANGIGVDISKFVETPTGRILEPVATIDAPAIHDTFTQVDPIDGKTYLYIADGFGSGFQVYDVTDPASPEKVAEWDLTPECTQDWYAHTIDVTHRGNKRYVTLPAELFGTAKDNPQSAANQARGCGAIRGNGDKVGPLWIVDASEFSELGQPGDSDTAIKSKSESALVTTWTNPAGRAAGQLLFSPHNQQIVGDKIYLSDYHGGVFVLDAAGAFAGRAERPRELAHTVPSGDASNEAARPIFTPGPGGPTPRYRGRSNIWDMVFYKGYVLAADQIGGFYSLQYEGDAPAPTTQQPTTTPDVATAEPKPGSGSAPGSSTPGASACEDRVAPRSRFPRRGGLKITRRGLNLQGMARERGCADKGQITRVLVAVGRVESKKRCRFVTARGKLGKKRPCSKPTYIPAQGTARWTLRLKAKLPKGRYRAQPRGIDAAGNVETREPRFTRVR